MFIDIIIFLLVGALLTVLLARLKSPQNLIAVAIIMILIFGIAVKLFGFGAFTWILTIWMLLIVGGLYWLRHYFRSQG
ncbi:hypothetical protein PQ472_05335 [Lacticaseibacillus pabuli]|uniref:YesK-like protein n=1 Tax=Lacticaseibacillus pabuli TaxID=3025672 RepID=A0ABY7WWZ6_9LACO|nr:hypothetical protein [Lacticaseibacillus sp. KACC 23028]WDF83660.1 hypothetical protein PQ472_05335 [Lacticaseibacillus sp. KACC 23028]